MLTHLLRDVSICHRRSNEEKLIRDCYLIGHLAPKRDGHVIHDVWEDGGLIKEIRQKIVRNRNTADRQMERTGEGSGKHDKVAQTA